MSYTSDILNLPNLTIDNIVKIANKYLPKRYQQYTWTYPGLNHGEEVLETEELCNAYIVSYGIAHTRKLERAFDDCEFPFNQLSKGFELYDWGCGQGIGSITLISILKKKGLLHNLKKVTLVEPSNMTRDRAVLHVNKILENENVIIEDCPLFLPSDNGDDLNSITSIEVKQPCAVHIFSNILDIGSVSLKKTSKLITSSGIKHIVICVGPCNKSEYRINKFVDYFTCRDKLLTTFHETCFNKYPNSEKYYSCFIKSFMFTLTSNVPALFEYKYFVPIQLFACYAEKASSKKSNVCAFEILAPFDITAHKVLNPIYALLSNIISRGYHTLPSPMVLKRISNLQGPSRISALSVIARIQKAFVEMLISDRMDMHKNSWNILVLEDETNIANIAIEDFYDLYNHLISLTVEYANYRLPTMNICTREIANTLIIYDAIIDVSFSQYCNPKDVSFSEYKVRNDCYFIVRSSRKIYEERTFYTTKRIKYKQFATRNSQGNYQFDEESRMHLRYFLNLIFGMEDFRPGQLEILNRALQLKSVIGLLPTGGGKSLTYQLASMLQPAVTLVVDPLKGLMKDQYDGLLKMGIDCISYINSDVPNKWEREQQLTKSQTLIMFVSPERLSIHKFRETLRSMRESEVYFAYGVIDEVHCVSEWGHDFRLAYLHLGRNLYNYVLPCKVEGEDNHVSLFGLTATASFDVLADVERELSGQNAYSLEEDATIRYENTNRLELQYYVAEINAKDAHRAWDVGDIKEDNLLNIIKDATAKITEIQAKDVIQYIKKSFIERENIIDEGKIREINDTKLNVNVEQNWYLASDNDVASIVFCPRASSRANLSVGSVADKLRCNGIHHISTYKGGDDISCQDDFLSGKTNLMVATKAFGMGIDKPNVRLTFHLNYPTSLESFVQEAGRAGRDKEMALATIMYSPKKFYEKNVHTNDWNQFSSDYKLNKYFYDANFLGEKFELYMMELLMERLAVKISYEEFKDIDKGKKPKIEDINGIIKYINSYDEGSILTYYVYYEEDDKVLDEYNKYLSQNNLPIFDTPHSSYIKTNGYKYAYGSTKYKDAIQKAIYRMCVIGLIDDFTEDYNKKTFRITTVCQNPNNYCNNLKSYYRKYYSEEKASDMMNEVYQMASKDCGIIRACLKHLTAFIYRSIAEKRARGILDMEQFCNMAITSEKDWKETNEDLKDFIYYYFNSKYAREGFVTYDSKRNEEISFSLKDDTNKDLHKEKEITSFNLVKKYMRVVDADIVNHDSQKDNVKHLQGAVRLIRRASADYNPVLSLLNIFCILFLRQQDNEMLEEEICNDYSNVVSKYKEKEQLNLLDEYTNLLIEHGALDVSRMDYLKKVFTYVQLKDYLDKLKTVKIKYTLKK